MTIYIDDDCITQERLLVHGRDDESPDGEIIIRPVTEVYAGNGYAIPGESFTIIGSAANLSRMAEQLSDAARSLKHMAMVAAGGG